MIKSIYTQATQDEINNPDLEAQYQLYLKGMELTEEEMHPQQKVQLKQSFMAGSGQLTLLLRNACEMRGPNAVRLLLHMLAQQVVDYWNKEIGKDTEED